MDKEFEVDRDEWDRACMKAFEALHNNTRAIGEGARRVGKEMVQADTCECEA